MAEDSLTRIANLTPSLSRSEKKIGLKLLKEPNWFIRESVRSIATAAGVSEPTVIRFCRNVGFEGFKDLKFQIAQELALRQALSDAQIEIPDSDTELKDPSGASSGDTSNVCGQVLSGAQAVLNRARAALDIDSLERGAKAVAEARRIAVYGIGGSSGILADEMHNRLSRLSLASATFTDSYVQRMSAATLSKGDVAIFVSSTGRPQSLQDGLELARHYGATTLAIAPADSFLGREVDICLHVHLSQSGVDELQPNPMRYAQLYVIDCLAYYVARELGEIARTSLRRVRASVASLHGIASQQPVGD